MSRRWLCRIGFHKWGAFGLPYFVEYRDMFNRPHLRKDLTRICERCGAEDSYTAEYIR